VAQLTAENRGLSALQVQVQAENADLLSALQAAEGAARCVRGQMLVCGYACRGGGMEWGLQGKGGWRRMLRLVSARVCP